MTEDPQHIKYLAHRKELNGDFIDQTVDGHLRETAVSAESFCQSMPWAKWAYMAGLWHDIGKYSDAFQRRIRGSKERADHSTPGALLASNVFSDKMNFENLIGRILGYGIAGHHTGLPDGNSVDETCLNSRLLRANFDFSPCPPEIFHNLVINILDPSLFFADCRNGGLHHGEEGVSYFFSA